MPKRLSADQVASYERNGFVAPLEGFDAECARRYRTALESLERASGGTLAPVQQRKMHLYLPWVDEIVHTPAILDAVEDLIGPNLLVFHITLWLKEPHTPAFVSWHQDSTYFGLSPHEHVTAWVALSASSLESGAVQVVPGSHKRGQLAHTVRQDAANLLATGQSAPVDACEKKISLVLHAGQFSLHHTLLLHNSLPNRSNDRRIGLGISYIPSYVRCSSRTPLSALLVRGADPHRHFLPEQRPDPRDLEAARHRHGEAMARWQTARRQLISEANAAFNNE